MAKVRIKAGAEAVAKAEDQGDFILAPAGPYTAVLQECAPGYAKGDDDKPDKSRPYLECIWKIDGVGREGTKPEVQYSRIWDYVTFGEETDWKRAQFGAAMGLPVVKGEIDGEIEVEEGKPGSVIGVRALIRVKHEKDKRDPEGEKRAKIGWMGPLSGPALADNPMDDSGPEASTDPFADAAGEEELDLWTAETLGELDLKALGEEAKTNWDLTPQDFIVQVKGKTDAAKTKDAIIAAILEAQGAEEPEADAGTPDAAADDPF